MIHPSAASHPVRRHRVGWRALEQIAIDQHRGNRHPPPLLPPCSTRLPAPVSPAPVGGDGPAALSSPLLVRGPLLLVQRDFLGEGVPHRHQPHFQVGLLLLLSPPLAGQLCIPL